MKNNFIKITNEYKRNNSVTILEFTDKVAQFMSISTLVITKPGGLTSTEALTSNLPMLIINPIPGQEEENAEFLEENKVAIWLKKDDDINSILNILLNDKNILKTMKDNTRLISRPNSTKNICEILTK